MNEPAHRPTPSDAAQGDAALPRAGDRPAWRAVCRQQAQAAAEAEARAKWRVADDDMIPFNYRWEHVQHVVGLARWLATETGADAEIVEAAAWLHDVRKAEPEHALRGAEAAQEILAGTDFPPHKVDAVADAIRQHEGLYRDESTPLTPLEAGVLWDADKLSKIGVQALIYALSTRYVCGQTLVERRTRNQRFLDDVLVRTVASMNTAPAQRLAAERLRQNQLIMDLWAADEALVRKHLP